VKRHTIGGLVAVKGPATRATGVAMGTWFGSKWRCHAIFGVVLTGGCLAMCGSAKARPESAADVAVAPRFTVLAQPISVPAGARFVSLRVAATAAAVLRSNGRSFRVGTRVRHVVVPIRPGAGTLILRLTLTARRATTRLTLRIPRTTAWQTVLAGIGRNGTVSKRTALQAFALAFGPLPGVSVPSGPTGEVVSGTVAVRWIRGYWSQLTPAQQAAAAKMLAPSPRMLSSVSGWNDDPKAYETQLKAIIATIGDGSHLRRQLGIGANPLTLTVYVGEAAATPRRAGTLAWTDVLDSNGGATGQPTRCEIHVLPVLATKPPTFQTAVLAHEAFHCFQATMVPLTLYNSPSDSWIFEGQAEWVGGDIAGDANTTYANDWWQRYLTTPGIPLFERSRDALGFYAHMSESGLEPWRRFQPMLQAIAAGSNEAAYAVATPAGPASDHFHFSWASGYFRKASLGRDWTFEGNGITADNPSVTSVGPGAPLSAPPYTESMATVTSDAEVTHFAVTGYGRLIDPAFAWEYTSALSDIYFCTGTKPCECPAGSSYNGPPLLRMKSPTYLALTGGPDGAKATIEGISLDRFCKKKDKGVTGTWVGAIRSTYFGGEESLTLSLTQVGTTVTGTVQIAPLGFCGETGKIAISGEVNKQQATLRFVVVGIETRLLASVSGNTMSGSWTSTEAGGCARAVGTWEASRGS
jgi:hypothetical protein